MDQTPKTAIQSIVLVLPAYNEEAAIGALIRQAWLILAAEVGDWSMIVVDDGSTDRTVEEIEAVSKEIPRIQLVRHEHNRGLGPAIMSGLIAAVDRNDADNHLIVCMDADLTHPPETIPAMRRAVEAGADLVIASRFQPASRQHGVPLFRRFLSVAACRVFTTFLDLPGVRDYTCGFRAIRASLIRRGLDRFGADGLITRAGFACTDELLVHLAMLSPVIREVPFTLRYDRKQGASKMRLGLTIVETLKLIWGFRRQMKRAREKGSHTPFS